MITYTINITNLRKGRYQAYIMADGKKLTDCGIWRNIESARNEANAIMNSIEKMNTDENGYHYNAIFFYLKHSDLCKTLNEVK